MIKIDESQFPVVVVTFYDSTEEEVTDYLLRIEKVFQKGMLSIIADLTKLSITSVTPKKRAILGEGLNVLAEKYKKDYISEAIVLSSSIQKNFLVAVNWFRGKRHFSQSVFTSMEEAKNWTKEQLANANKH